MKWTAVAAAVGTAFAWAVTYAGQHCDVIVSGDHSQLVCSW